MVRMAAFEEMCKRRSGNRLLLLLPTYSLPGSSLLAPDTLWLALTGTSRAGAWLAAHSWWGRAHANQTQPAPAALPSCQHFPQRFCFLTPRAAARPAAAAVDGNPFQPVLALLHLHLPKLLLRHTLDHHPDHISLSKRLLLCRLGRNWGVGCVIRPRSHPTAPFLIFFLENASVLCCKISQSHDGFQLLLVSATTQVG